MATSTLILMIITVTQVICAPQTGNTLRSTIRTPVNLTYDELLYIVQTRRGTLTEQPKSLTPCARAILACCKNGKINESCSEALKCGAFFFDDNPCSEKFMKDALDAARSFYQQFKKDSK